MELVCTSGTVDAQIGDRFTDAIGEWEIVSFKTGHVTVKPVGMEIPSWFRGYANPDGTMDFCADSVAARLLQNHDGKDRDARGDILTLPP